MCIAKTSTTRNRNCLLPELGDFVTMTIIAKTKTSNRQLKDNSQNDQDFFLAKTRMSDDIETEYTSTTQ